MGSETDFFKASPDPCCILDSEDRVVAANPSLERALGHPSSRLLGSSWHELVHPDDQGRLRTALKKTEAPGESAWLEARWIARNGEYRPLSWHVARAGDSSLYCSGYDLSRQKRSEQESASWQQRTQLMVSASEDAHWDWNPVTGEVHVSAAWNRMIGAGNEPSACRFEDLKRAFRAEDQGAVDRALQAHLIDHRPLRIECQIVAAGGALRPVRLTGQAAWDESGDASRLVCWIRDLSDAKAEHDLMVEQQIKLMGSAKLAQLGRIAAGVAHEINNPTSVVFGYASQLKVLLDRGDTPSEKLAQIATKIETVTVRIAKIIKGLRNFARDGEQDPFIRTPVMDVLDEAFELLREQMRSASVDLIVDPAADRGLACEVRNVQLSQVLVNLMQNATDAISGLQVKWIRVSLADLGDRVSILIRDSGTGIPESVRQKLMTPFFTTKPLGKGTGLGLSISKGIIESHGGRLYLNESDANTCFVIELPKVQKGRKTGTVGSNLVRNLEDPGSIES